ncbi:2-C-methyl-D-erythritol 4-phosphate cytidylyltransferase [Pseudoflavonifractor sp. 524-17]|uniref:2-C-methyl-D-erythritol 4-phosphate cytidylyltransferase n=1 Tax=Pseudoflavonifractor sp. 524-17 TaxID=2304577 RepID=UPI00137AFBAB|nr:2-C-methyl-D-erythritol 4-phosphate cytidylyltransferase [Pseudoflavonifractor sp. 524-17]NCE64202.1 2-C-methyl-D-erythritol 4-phosphate cytidylyltransferase [Pseudoflavonifractor sp. 524-17]
MADWFQRLFRRKKTQDPFCTAVVPAAGCAARMEGVDKITYPLRDVPILLHTLSALDACPRIHEIVVVTRADLIVPIGQLCREACLSKVARIVVGGASRTESVLAGIRAASEEAALIAIHDGARPLVSQAVLDEVIYAGERCGAAAPAVPVKDTIKQAENGIVTATPDRAQLFAVQTPQVFEASLIRGALVKALEDGVTLTDDCAAVERLGMKVTLTAGAPINLKITTPEDLAVAEALLYWRDRT